MVALVSIDDLKDVKFKEKAFKKVVIKDEYKQIVKAMVEAYTQEQPGFSDIVSGKGRGLTVLLHGPPGTGKTLTAGITLTVYSSLGHNKADVLYFCRIYSREREAAIIQCQLWRPWN